MRRLRDIDGAIIDYVAQPIANRLADVATPKQISLFLLMGVLFANAILFISQWKTSNTIDLGLGLMFLLGPGMYFSASRRPDTNGRGANPCRVLPSFIATRLVSLIVGAWAFFSDPTIDGWISLASVWLWVGYVYFEACGNPPPRPRKQTIGQLAEVRARG